MCFIPNIWKVAESTIISSSSNSGFEHCSTARWSGFIIVYGSKHCLRRYLTHFQKISSNSEEVTIPNCFWMFASTSLKKTSSKQWNRFNTSRNRPVSCLKWIWFSATGRNPRSLEGFNGSRTFTNSNTTAGDGSEPITDGKMLKHCPTQNWSFQQLKWSIRTWFHVEQQEKKRKLNWHGSHSFPNFMKSKWY